MSRETKITAIPPIPPLTDRQLSNTLTAMKEALEVRVGHRGDSLDKAVTFRDLTESGMVTIPVGVKASGTTLKVNQNPGDLSIPPAPRDLAAAPTFSHVLLTWEGGFLHPLVGVTEIFRHTSNNLNDAVQIDAVPNGAKMYTDTVAPGTTHYYWVRFRSPANVPGPFNATDGVVGTTSKKVSDLIGDLNDAIGQTHLSNTLSTSINKIATNETNIATLDTFVQSRSQNNLLDMTVWKPQSINGNLTGDNGGVWNLNGTAAENSLVLYDDGPSGHSTVVWKALSANGSADGGWNAVNINIDHLKTYRSVVWIKKIGTLNGATYLGCKGGSTKNLDGSVHNNPYFWHGDLPQLNKWYLIVGIIHGSSYAGSYSGVAGVYDPVTGEKVLTGTEFKMASTATTQTHRSYLYYTSVDNVIQYFANPRVEEVNGNEPSLGAWLANKDFVSTVQTTKQAVDGISAEQFVKVDVNGNVAGYGIYGSSTFNEFAVNADVFKIADGTSNIQPFVVVTGAGLTVGENGTQYGNTTQSWQQTNHPAGKWFPPGTFIDTALIADASIDSAKIANLTVDFANITGALSANQMAAINIDAGQITGGSINGITITGGRINSGSAVIEDGDIEGAYIKGGVIEGAFILSSQSALVTEAGTPHYAYRLGVTDSKTVNGSTYAKAVLGIRPYNYQYTSTPNVTGSPYGNNYYRYRRQNICGSSSTPPTASAKFYWSGSATQSQDGVSYSTDFFTVRIRKFIGTNNVVDTESFTFTGSTQHQGEGNSLETRNYSLNVNGFIFSTTVNYRAYVWEKLYDGYQYVLYADPQWVNFTVTAPSTFNFNTATATGWGFDIQVTAHRGSSTNLELTVSDEAENDY